MERESIVYGCIKNLNFDSKGEQRQIRRNTNRDVLLALPSSGDWNLLTQEMFSIPADLSSCNGYLTDVMHFGASYKAIEYEWEHWISSFEAMLKKMYWGSAIVHLETELSGNHTFTWESSRAYHEPDGEDLAARCEWSQESAIA